jgi:exodeoxyribonuclease VII large subunit
MLPVMRRCIADMERSLQSCGKLLESLSYTKVLERGFAVVRRREGTPVTSAKDLKAGTAIDIELRDGRAPATVDGARPARRGAAEEEKQGRLI